MAPDPESEIVEDFRKGRIRQLHDPVFLRGRKFRKPAWGRGIDRFVPEQVPGLYFKSGGYPFYHIYRWKALSGFNLADIAGRGIAEIGQLRLGNFPRLSMGLQVGYEQFLYGQTYTPSLCRALPRCNCRFPLFHVISL